MAAEEQPGQSGVDERHLRFTSLMSRYHASLMSFILSLVANWSDAEDLLQQTSVVMWQKFDEFDPGSSFIAWGMQIARYQTMNHVRKEARRRQRLSTELVEKLAGEGPGDAERLEAERVALRACLQKLDPASRTLLGRCYDAGVNMKQVAGQLKRTPNSIYKGLNRIRESLLRCILHTLAREGW
jgi:RNA polymerase sigma-70 factor (ECF subfamily)